MAAHAKLSPSSASRWVPCPASVALQDPLRKAVNIYMAEGTLAHLIAEFLLRTGGIPDTHAVGTTHVVDGLAVDVTSQMHEHVEYYVSYVHEHLNPAAGDMLLPEVKVPLPYSPEEHGTSDVLGYRVVDKTLVVIDLKYGQGVTEEAEGNWQLIIYALGAYDQWHALLDIEGVEYHIAQPRKYNMVKERVTVAVLMDYRARVMAAALAVYAPNPTFGPGEKGCRWCSHAPKCTALAEWNLKVMGAEFETLPEVTKTDPATLTPERIRALLDHTTQIQDWLKNIAGYVTGELASGRAFPGYKLVEGRTLRRWVDEDEAAMALLEHYTVAEVFKNVLISPAQTDNLIKKAPKEVKDKVARLIEKPPASPVLAKESDKRKALVINLVDEFDTVTSSGVDE
jgi:hypothetical protein